MAHKSFLSSLVASRQRQANAFVSNYLLTMDDETLRRHGYNRKDIAAQKASNNAGF